MSRMDQPPQQTTPLVAHVIFRLSVGGLENGLVNLINRMPKDAYRHAIICIKDSTEFSKRIQRDDVEIFHLNKKEGHDWSSFVRFYTLLKQIRPDIVHTRNLSAIEYQVPAWLAGVKCRIHGEHGWDTFDPEGNNVKYQWLRRLVKPLVQRYVPLSRHLEQYLLEKIKVPPNKITRICNGVDTDVFYPVTASKPAPAGCPWDLQQDLILVGTVGRMHGVKDQITLVKAFIEASRQQPELQTKLKLMIAGDGPLREQALKLLADSNLSDNAWLPGERKDIAEFMRALDIFVLPSLAEGISNTILEAMATGLPVIATAVGGNPELVDDGVTGMLTPSADSGAMALKILDYANHKQKRQAHGQNSRARALEKFSLDSMTAQYRAAYDSLMTQE